MDVATITAWGTMLTGIAAIVAVFGGFFTMRHQIRKTAITAWIESFRINSSTFLATADRLEFNSGIEDSRIFFKSATLLRLYLSSKKPAQKNMIDSINLFSLALMNTGELDQQQFSNAYPGHYSRILRDIEAVIEEAESSL